MMAKLQTNLAEQVDAKLQEIQRKKEIAAKLENDIKKKID